jgi:putative protein-disulfide isomerase
MFALYYFHDPMCSWCWGYRPTAELLFSNLPENISLEKILGGLAPDNDEPISAGMLGTLSGHWNKIQKMLGAEFNFDFWEKCEPRRSTYPACRAVIAASNQRREADMILAIQHAFYIRAMNPSDTETHEQLARELSLDVALFNLDLRSAETEMELQRQIAFARSSSIDGFPALALHDGDRLVPVRLDYKSHEVTLDHLQSLTAP